MSHKTPIFVPRGNSLTLTTDAFSAGIYVRQSNPGEEPYTPDAIAASTEVVLGPFNEPRSYLVDVDGNEITYVLEYSGVFTGSDGADYAPLASPTFTGTVVLPATTSIGNASGTEIGYLDGVTSAIQTQITAKEPTVVTTQVGAVNAGTTVAERGDGFQHTTTLTVSSTLPAIAGGAALSVGKLLYTFPAGAIIVNAAYMSMGITQSEAHIDADTPDVGLGTVIAAGANALLSDTSGAENILTGQTAGDCLGTAAVKTVANQVLVIEASDPHTLYFNVADDWAASGDAAAAIAGTVVINWQFMA